MASTRPAVILAAALTVAATWTLASAAPRPPVTPERIAAARAQADTLIASTGAPGLFVNVTDADIPKVRHVPSNLTCVFDSDSTGNRLETGSGSATESVICRSSSPTLSTTLSARRLAAAWPEAQASADAAQTIAATLNSPTPVSADGPAFVLGKKAFGQASTVGGERDGRKVAAWVGVLDAGEWGVTQQVESSNLVIAQMSGQLLLKTTLLRLSGVIPGGGVR